MGTAAVGGLGTYDAIRNELSDIWTYVSFGYEGASLGCCVGQMYNAAQALKMPNPLIESTVETAAEIGKKTDFYVTPSGEAVPATGYRYISETSPYLKNTTTTMKIPANAGGTYFSFNNYDMPNPGALQVPHDASVKLSFDTLQIIDDISIPYGNWGTASYLEPITTDFPIYGPGGATQVITHSEINIDSVNFLNIH